MERGTFLKEGTPLETSYSKIERDIQEPSIEQLRRICKILKLDPRYLLDIDGFDIINPSDRKLLEDIKTFIMTHPINE